MYIFTVSEKVLFEVDQLRSCIEDQCPEIEFDRESMEISKDQMDELSAKRNSILEDNRISAK